MDANNKNKIFKEGVKYFYCMNVKHTIYPICDNPGKCKHAMIFIITDVKFVFENGEPWCVDSNQVKELI